MKKIWGLFIISCFISNYSIGKSLRVLCIPLLDRYEDAWEPLFKLKKELEKEGIILLGEGAQEYDLIMCNKVNEEIIAYNKPIIILERQDSASLTLSAREYLNHDLVIGVFKNIVLSQAHLHNAPHACNKYHLALINEIFNISDLNAFNPISQDLIKEKVYCVPWDLKVSCFSEKFKEMQSIAISSKKKRLLDVFFAGHVGRNAPRADYRLYELHRQQAVDILNKLPVNIVSLIVSGRLMSFKEYKEKMSMAKIVVSPWGFGEWCYRDFEAFLSGAILVKPYTDFVKTYPCGMYRDGITYVACKADFSDLHEKIAYILAHYDDYQSMRKCAKDSLVKSMNIASFIEYFAKSVKKVFKNYTNKKNKND